eukprot:gb/GEZN01001342.1/.p1 GENE.gb/GEZN01001342.1/~~gb/GEZN01001342.1/.p1  ORF type:complete len:882 (-),score=223.63 gb/GEZN01001342.1/:446-3091(-)
MSVVGIDFGSESCVVAIAKSRGVETVQNSVGNRKTASLVSFVDKRRYLGDSAVPYMRTNAKNSIMYVKRLLGMTADDPTLQEEVKYVSAQVLPGDDNLLRVRVRYEDKEQDLRPELITAALLTELKGTAEKGLGSRVSDCVIGVPHFWPEGRRRALLDAAKAAGLNVLRLFNENTAVALTYGLMRPLPLDEKRLVVFVDFGLTQFSCSLVSFTQTADGGELTVLATSTDPNLGCRDMDNILASFFVEEIKTRYKMDVSRNDKSMQKLLTECSRVKTTLSANNTVVWGVEYIMDDKDVKGTINREMFEETIKKNFTHRFESVLNALFKHPGAQGIGMDQIFAVELIGGGVRIPCVASIVSAYFKGKELSRTCDGDESIARGCTWQCAMLSPSFRVKKFEVKDINQFPIELAWGSDDSPLSRSYMTLPEEEKKTLVFGAGNAVPSLKLVSFVGREKPFNLVARYKSPIPPYAKEVIGMFQAQVPAPADPANPPKLKLKCRLDLNNCLEIPSGILIKEITVDVPDQAAMDAAAAAAAAAAPAPMETDEKEKEDGDAAKMETDEPTKDAAAPMDTTEDTTKDKTKLPVIMKQVKQQVKEEIRVQSLFAFGLDAVEAKKIFEQETHMANQDRVLLETGEARNALEGYYLEMRGMVEDEEALGQFATEQEKEAFVDLCRNAESWLEGDGWDAQKSAFVKELEKLKAAGTPIQNRKWELDHRPAYADALKKSCLQYSRWATENKEEKYAHIDAAQRQEIKNKASQIDQWLVDALIKQEKEPKTNNPVVTCTQIRDKHTELQGFCDKIINTPKPKEKKEEPKTEAKADADGNKKSSKKSSKADKAGKASKKAKKEGGGGVATEPDTADLTEAPVANGDETDAAPMDTES